MHEGFPGQTNFGTCRTWLRVSGVTSPMSDITDILNLLFLRENLFQP